MSWTTDQYRIIADGAGWFDQRACGRLRFDGRDASSLLQSLVTNDVQALAAGRAVYAAYLTPQGRMIADLTIVRCGDYLLAAVAPGLAAPLATRFDHLIFSEDVRVSDVSASTAQIAVVGARAADVLGHPCVEDSTIVETSGTGLPRVEMFLPAAEMAAAVAHLEASGVVPGSPDLFDAIRIDAGRPSFGIDMTDETIPLEAGLLERGISTTKGCYVGQEVIIRVLHRGGGRVAKRLVKLAFAPSCLVPPAEGSPLLDLAESGREVGRITSAAMSPDRSGVIALGYVHRDAAEEGRRLSVAGDHATIVAFAG